CARETTVVGYFDVW
nr:immunoglobulin heavy chain junction region [Mus musculus]